MLEYTRMIHRKSELHISSILEHELESMEYDFAGAFFGKKPFIKTPQFYKEIY